MAYLNYYATKSSTLVRVIAFNYAARKYIWDCTKFEPEYTKHIEYLTSYNISSPIIFTLNEWCSCGQRDVVSTSNVRVVYSVIILLGIREKGV